MKQIDFYLKFVILILGISTSSIVCLAQEVFPVTYKEYNEIILTHVLTPVGPVPTAMDAMVFIRMLVIVRLPIGRFLKLIE